MKVNKLNQFCSKSMVAHLGIEFYEGDNGDICAKMPVDERTRQPHGFLHGGATIALAETLASVVSSLKAGEGNPVFGYHVDASLLSSVREGYVHAVAHFVHEGRSSYLLDITIKSESGETVALCRVTVKVVKRAGQ